MLIAVRTVSETDDWHFIEGLAYPFKGRDTYNTFFSARTNYHWDMFPDTDPSAVRADATPQFIRPMTYHHGFDPDFGLERIGGWSPVRMDDDGIWVQGQIDKRKTYYATRIRPLMEAKALGLSGGSAEHSVRIDNRTGEVLDWPAYELALTPVESNPLASIAARADTGFRIVIDGAHADGGPVLPGQPYIVGEGGPETIAIRKNVDPNVGGGVDRDKLPDEDFAGPNRSFPIVTAGDVSDAASSLGRAKGDRDAIKAKIISIAKRKGFGDSLPKAWQDGAAKAGVRSSATDAATGYGILGSLMWLIDCESGEPDQVSMLQDSADSLSSWIDAERAEIGSAEDDAAQEAANSGNAFLSGIRAGARNSVRDAAALSTAHDNIASVLGMDCAPGDTSARSAEGAPTLRLVAALEPPNVALESMATRAAEEAAKAAVRRLTGRDLPPSSTE